MQSRLLDRLYQMAIIPEDQLEEALSQIAINPTEAVKTKARGLYEQLLCGERQVKTFTFHGFCQDILRKFPLEADVPPGFELLDDEPSYLATAWDKLYQDATLYPDNSTAQALESLYELTGGLWNTQNCLNNFVSQRSDWWAYTSEFISPCENASEKLRKQLNVDLEDKPLNRFFSTTTRDQLLAISQLLILHDTKTNLKFVDQLNSITETEIFSASLAESKLRQWLARLSEILFKKNGDERFDKPVKARAKKMSEAGEDKFLSLCQSICQSIKQINEIANKQHQYALCEAWYIAGNALLQEFQQLKQQQRLLDFTDLEWRTYQLLNHSENAQWVQYKLDQRIEHLLVDEFQDTNPTQWRLLLPIMQEFSENQEYSEKTEKHRSVFLVGDEKQSIYSFRRADPKLFSTASTWLTNNLGAESFPMDKSRRSSSPIMNLVNSLFSSEDYNRTLDNFKHHSTFLESLPGKIELLPLITELEETSEPAYFRNPINSPLEETDDCYFREGNQIAEKILSLIESNASVIREGKSTRLKFSDIMILIRSRKHLASYEAAFREKSIPYLSNNKGTLFECQEIKDLIALLEILYTPYNNLSLAIVLRSPIFNCNNEELLLLSNSFNKGEQSSWLEVLINNQTNDNWPSSLKHAAKHLVSWKALVGYLPTHDLLDRIFRDVDLLVSYQRNVPKHFKTRVKANLTQFLSLALDIDSGRYPSLGRFIARLHSLIQNDASPDELLSGESEDCISILTIHGAKGLEAPIVFLADSADNKREKNLSYTSLVDWPEQDNKPTTFMLCPKKESRCEIVNQLLATQRRKGEIEDANLLYVALTRPRQRLYISGSGKEEWDKSGWYGLIKKNWPQSGLENDDHLADSSSDIHEDDNPAMTEYDLPRFFSAEKLSATSITDVDSSTVPNDDSSQLRGTIIHRAIDLLSNNTRVLHDEVKAQLTAEFSNLQFNHLIDDIIAEAHSTVCHETFSFVFDSNNFDNALNEIPIQFNQNNRLTHGIIDRLVLSKNKIFIVDYKTFSGEKQELERVAFTYKKQMYAYRDAVLKIWPDKAVELYIIFTHHLTKIEIK